MKRKKYLMAMLLGLALLFGGAPLAQEAENKPSSQAQEDQTPDGTVKESYMDKQKKEELLEPYQPGRAPGMPPNYDSTQDGLAPRHGSSMGRTKPQPLPSPLAPLERREKRLRREAAVPQPRPSDVAPGPDLATARLSREGVYKVSYTGDKPNSYGLPFSWQVMIQDKNGLPIKGAHLSLRLNTKRGHTPVITGMAVRELGKGLYKISGIRCDRSGLWRAVLEVQGRGYGDTVTFNLMVP